eukprot:IDg10710t1
MLRRRSTCGARGRTRIVDGLLVGQSPRDRKRQLEVVSNDLGFNTQLRGVCIAVCAVCAVVHVQRSDRRARSVALCAEAVSAVLALCSKVVCTNRYEPRVLPRG